MLITVYNQEHTNGEVLNVTMGVLSLKRIYRYAIGLLMYEHGRLCFLNNYLFFSLNAAVVYQYDFRHAICITRHSSTRGLQSLSHCGPRVWDFIRSSMKPNIVIGLFYVAPRKIAYQIKMGFVNLYDLHMLSKQYAYQVEEKKRTIIFLVTNNKTVNIANFVINCWFTFSLLLLFFSQFE